MDDFLRGIFESEIETQCRFMVIGAHIVNERLQQHTPESGHVTWFALQGILISAANVSKLLWGSKSADDVAARQRVRNALQVDDTSAFYDRKVRNAFEHFDEKLESWFAQSENHIYIGRLIGGQTPSRSKDKTRRISSNNSTPNEQRSRFGSTPLS